MYLFNKVRVYATGGSEVLGGMVCQALGGCLPKDIEQPGQGELSRYRLNVFDNENMEVQLGDSVRGDFVVVIHTQVPPVSNHLIELFALLDALKNAKPADILVVFPYMPYSRSDKKDQPRISVMSQWLADTINRVSEVKHVLLLDPHDPHLKHYFHPTADEITAIPLLVDHLNRDFFVRNPKNQAVVVFSDSGAADRFSKVPHLLGLPSAYIDKERTEDGKKLTFKGIVGDVRGKICVLIDDEILTGGTAIGDAQKLLDAGAKTVVSAAVHGLLAKKGLAEADLVRRMADSPLERFILTNTIPHQGDVFTDKFAILSVHGLLAQAISRILTHGSLNELHRLDKVDLYRPD